MKRHIKSDNQFVASDSEAKKQNVGSELRREVQTSAVFGVEPRKEEPVGRWGDEQEGPTNPEYQSVLSGPILEGECATVSSPC